MARQRRPRVIAHRGFSGQFPENSLLAFKEAIALGVDMIEFDVQLTKDKVPVICHDADVGRTTNGAGLLKEFTFSHLREFKSETGEPLPTLEEFVAIAKGRVGFQLEVKVPDAEYAILSVLREHEVVAETYFSSFNHAVLAEIRRRESAAHLATLESQVPLTSAKVKRRAFARMVQNAQTVNAWAIHPHFFNVTPELVSLAHAEGLEVNTWTVNSREIMAALLEMGVDGIITNHPDVLLDLLRETA